MCWSCPASSEGCIIICGDLPEGLVCRTVVVLHNQKWAASLMQTSNISDFCRRVWGVVPQFRTLLSQRLWWLSCWPGSHLGKCQACCLSSSWLCYGEWHARLLPAQVPRGAGQGAFISQVYIWALLWKWSKKLARTVGNYLFKIIFWGRISSSIFFPLLKWKFTEGIVTYT